MADDSLFDSDPAAQLLTRHAWRECGSGWWYHPDHGNHPEAEALRLAASQEREEGRP